MAVLLAVDPCGLQRLVEHITDNYEELQFVANGRLEPIGEGYFEMRCLCSADNKILSNTPPTADWCDAIGTRSLTGV